MDENIPEEQISVFEKLKEIRISKGIKLDEIAAHTKISLNYLEALEAGKPDVIPAIYDTLFLKTYLTYLGIENQQDYLDEIQTIRKQMGSHQTTIMRKAQIERSDRRKSGMIKSIYIGLPLLFVATIVIVLAINSTTAETDMETEIKELSVREVVEQMQPTIVSPEVLTGDSLKMDTIKVTTRLQALERTWLRVIRDHRDTSEYLLRPAEKLNLEADSVLNFIIGKAGGISFSVNDDSIGVLGDSGQVVTNLKITSAGIVSKRLKQIIKKEENADSLDIN